jgi:hypothetical protein
LGRIKSRPGPSLLTLFLSLVSVFATLIRSIGSYSHRLCGDQESLDHLQPRDARTKLSLSHEHDCKMQVLHSFFVSGSDFFLCVFCGSLVLASVSAPANTELGERPTHEGIAESSPHSSEDCVPNGPESFVS